jgi:cytochrome P450
LFVTLGVEVAPVLASVRSLLRRALLSRSPGIDLTRLDRVPDRLSWPLKRDGMEPVARLAQTREAKGPVARVVTFLGVDVWLVTGDAEAREMLADQTSYSTDIRPYMGRAGSADGDIGGLGFTDPPDHTRLRKLLTPEFTMRRLARLKPTIARIIEEQLDETERLGAEGGEVDLAQSFAFPVPFLVICELLGLPVEEREKYRSMASARFDVTGGGIGTMGAVGGSREFLFEEVARQRIDPGPGLIGQIIREHGDEITDFDLAGLADGAFTGGLETSASMLGLGTAVLLDRPDLWQLLIDDDDSAMPIVDELLRYLSVVQISFPRFAKHDVVLGGQKIRKGAVVLAHLPAANRDPRVTHGSDLDPAHASGSHLAFGYGFHRCVGAELARMELRAAYPALARRFPGLTLAVGRDDLVFHDRSLVYGLESLPVLLDGSVTRV